MMSAQYPPLLVGIAIGLLIGLLIGWTKWLKAHLEAKQVDVVVLKIKQYCESVFPFTVDRFIQRQVITHEERPLAEKALIELCKAGVLEYFNGSYYLRGFIPRAPDVGKTSG